MEAAGIIALVRATTSTCIQASNLCSIWKNAPRDVFHLRDELQTYQTFYESIQTSIVESSLLNEIGLDMDEKRGGTEARKLQTVQRDALQGLLAKGLGVAKSIEVILIELIGKTVTGQEKGDSSLGTEGLKAALTLSKKLLWLRRMDTVKGLRKMLRDTTNGITFCLTILNVQVTVIVAKGGEEQIGAIVERSESNMIRHFYESAESSRRAFEGSMTTSMLALEKNIQSHVDRRIEGSMAAFDFSSRLEKHLLRSSWSCIPETASPRQNPGRRNATQSSTERDYNESPAVPTPTLHQIIQKSVIPIPNKLPSPCACSSGQGSAKRWEMSWIKSILAAIGITYSYYSFRQDETPKDEAVLSASHNSHGARSSFSCLFIHYQFPNWLVMAIMSVYFFRYDRPELLIRIHRIIPQDPGSHCQSVLYLAQSNDLNGIKSLLRTSPSAVYDVGSMTGDTALTLSVMAGNTSAVEILLHAGADPFQAHGWKFSAAKIALIRSLSLLHDQFDPAHQIADMMPIDELLEREGFTDLHRAVIRMHALDLQKALTRRDIRAQVGIKTEGGWTALHFAALLCPSGQKIQLLLDAGEDPNTAVQDPFSRPLYWACYTGNVNPLGDFSTALLDLLLDPRFEVDIDAANGQGLTAAMTSSSVHNEIVLKHLVRIGADITGPRCGDGWTTLHYTLMFNCHGGVRALLGMDEELGRIPRVEERYRAINTNKNCGILHIAARYSDKKTMRILKACKMTQLPEPAVFKDLSGKTAMEAFSERVGCGVPAFGPFHLCQISAHSSDNTRQEELEDLIHVWQELIASVNNPTPEWIHDQDEPAQQDNQQAGQDIWVDWGDSGELFFDALEA